MKRWMLAAGALVIGFGTVLGHGALAQTEPANPPQAQPPQGWHYEWVNSYTGRHPTFLGHWELIPDHLKSMTR
jgi:hypothetical protein